MNWGARDGAGLSNASEAGAGADARADAGAAGRRGRARRPRPAQIALAWPPGLRVSPRAFQRLCRANPELRLERTAKGALEAMPPASGETGARNAGTTAQLWNWNQRTKLGVVFDSSAGFNLPNGAVRGPDASWIARHRWDALPRGEREAFSPICPDFVVELRSRSDPPGRLSDKLAEFIAQGARLGWLIDPYRGTVEIRRPGRPVEILDRPAALSGEDVLPGFVLDLTDIWSAN